MCVCVCVRVCMCVHACVRACVCAAKIFEYFAIISLAHTTLFNGSSTMYRVITKSVYPRTQRNVQNIIDAI